MNYYCTKALLIASLPTVASVQHSACDSGELHRANVPSCKQKGWARETLAEHNMPISRLKPAQNARSYYLCKKTASVCLLAIKFITIIPPHPRLQRG